MNDARKSVHARDRTDLCQMTLAESLLPMLHDVRSIPGALGLRPHTVSILTEEWSGANTGEGTVTPTTLTLEHAGSQNVKVRWLNSEELALSELPSGSIEVGPLTPEHYNFGWPQVALLTDIKGALATGATKHLIVTGPMHPAGARYAITGFDASKAMRYMITAKPVGAA